MPYTTGEMKSGSSAVIMFIEKVPSLQLSYALSQLIVMLHIAKQTPF